MSNFSHSRKHPSDLFSDTSLLFESNLNKEYKEPEAWTIITALDRILTLSKESQLCDRFWDAVKHPVEFLTETLGLTKEQVVLLAILIETGETMSWHKFATFLGCSRITVMTYSEEIEGLVAKRWVTRSVTRDFGDPRYGFSLVNGVVTALRHNEPFVPEKIDGLTEQQFVDMLEAHLDCSMDDDSCLFKDDEQWMRMLCEANKSLPICECALSIKDIHLMSLLMLIVYDYAQWTGSSDEGLTMDSLTRLYPADFKCNQLRHHLTDGTNELFMRGIIEHKCEDGIVNNERYVLTKESKEQLLAEYKPGRTKVHSPRGNSKYLKKHTAIKEKELFFNPTEQEQIDRLTSILSSDNLASVQQRLEEQGMRKGFACLFYGGPGTGKTETVLQIARKTGRDIMQIDIAGLRDKWVGESEKNIKAVFSHYKDLCRNSEVTPILFFNEADGIISKRTEHIEHSVDKMNNAMQNIILQEIEDLDGILIATTNLTTNLDSAFERRFLFKIEFHKPNTDVKAKIWSSMLKNISDDDAHTLAEHFDFSGGQIENVARKRTIDFILSGEFADINGIESYCRCELLDNKKQCKPIVGFR